MRRRGGHRPIVIDFLDRVRLGLEHAVDLAHSGLECSDKMWRAGRHVGYVDEVTKWNAGRRHDTWDETARVMHEHCRAGGNGFEPEPPKTPRYWETNVCLPPDNLNRISDGR